MSDPDDNNSSRTQSSDSDKPRTPSPARPISRIKTGRSFTVPSKIPKRTATKIKSQSLSPPQTPDQPAHSSGPLDWGSGGEWSRLVDEVNSKAGELGSEAEERPLLGEGLVDEIKSERGEMSAEAETCPLLGESFVELLDDRALPMTGPESGQTALPVATTHLEHSTTRLGSPFEPKRTEEASNDSDSDDEVSSVPESLSYDQPTISSQLSTTLNPETKGSDTDDYYASESDQSVVHRHIVPRDSLEKIHEAMHPAKTKPSTSPQVVLRGLIRDAHREMMRFTLPHAHFSADDLREGLDFAFSMLQVTTTKLAMLAVLYDNLSEFSKADLHSWLARIDHLDPQSQYQPHMPVVFESLSVGEMQVALAELVQSRLIAEDEVGRMRVALMETTGNGRKNAESEDCVLDNIDGDEEANGKHLASDEDEAAWDGFFTALMVIVIGALYLCVR